MKVKALMLKILITGPESTGKSTLVEGLARHFALPFVSEYAREYIDELSRPYEEKDLLEIAKGQLRKEDEMLKKEVPVLLVDTDLTVIDIWSQEKYGRTHPWILEQMQRRAYDLYLITDVDLKWIWDPQREHPHARGRLMKLYQDSFKRRSIPYHIVSGVGEERVKQAIKIVESFLKMQID